jgi:hypothetical protein
MERLTIAEPRDRFMDHSPLEVMRARCGWCGIQKLKVTCWFGAADTGTRRG